MDNYLHIVCLDAPSPPVYGGAIDMYYKIMALAASGKKIILHYYDYNKHRGVGGLGSYCAEVYTYRRKKAISLNLPYIISSRINSKLIGRLNADDHPVLLEGLHCTGIIPYLKNRERVVVRMHNEESSYYKRLAASEPSLHRKLYFRLEAALLKKHYKKLAGYDLKYACLSETDIRAFEQCGLKKLFFIPCFIPWQRINCREGKGDYCLYHGNMKVPENELAAKWLIKVFDQLGIVLVIAGNGISAALRSRAKRASNVKIISDPSIEELDALVRDAHIHVLPSMNATGVKLKLLHAALEGRFCLVNFEGVKGSRIDTAVTVADDEGSYRQKVLELYQRPFTEEDKKNREQVLAVYDNKKNVSLLNALW